jgi:hypothetical protein
MLTRRLVSFRLSSLLWLTIGVAGGLAAWRSWELARLKPLQISCDRALIEWRCVRSLYDFHGRALAEDEAAARNRYFKNRGALELATANLWWPGNLLATRGR